MYKYQCLELVVRLIGNNLCRILPPRKTYLDLDMNEVKRRVHALEFSKSILVVGPSGVY